MTFILYSDQELFWLHRQQVAMFIGVFHLPVLVISKNLLIENFKRNLKPQLPMSWASAEPWRQDAGICSSPLLTTESLALLTGVLSVRSAPHLQNNTRLHNEPLSTSSGQSPQPEEMESVGSSCCNFQLWCWLSKNLWVLEQRAWKPVAGSCSGSRLDSPASTCWVSCHDYAHVKHLYVF